LIEWLEVPEQAGLRRSFSVWIKRVLFAAGNDSQQILEINDLVEIKTMLKDRIPQWISEGESRGEIKGKIKGEIKGEIKGTAKTLLKQLNLKFGTLPEEIEQRVSLADKEQLDRWVETILTATTLDEMFL
jgi:predicted transposase YdaD